MLHAIRNIRQHLLGDRSHFGRNELEAGHPGSASVDKGILMSLFHWTNGRRPPDDCGANHVVYCVSPDGNYRCLHCNSQLTKWGLTILPFTYHRDFNKQAAADDLDDMDDGDNYPGKPPEWRTK